MNARGFRPGYGRLSVARAIANTWNNHVPVGSSCSLIDDEGNIQATTTTSPAWVVGSRAVVSVDGRRGGYAVERIVPHAYRGELL